jgi:hypothetical protein
MFSPCHPLILPKSQKCGANRAGDGGGGEWGGGFTFQLPTKFNGGISSDIKFKHFIYKKLPLKAGESLYIHIYFNFNSYTVIRFFSTSAKFGICTVMGLNRTLVEDKMHTF